MNMRQLFLLIPLFIFVFLPSFTFAQDNGMHYVISGTIPKNGASNVSTNLYTEAVGNSCQRRSDNDIYNCAILIATGIFPGNPMTDVGHPKVTHDLFSPDKVIISSPNDPGISTMWTGEWAPNFELYVINSSYPYGINLMPNTTYTVTIKGGPNGLKAQYEKNYQPIEATLLQDYTFSFTTGNGSMPRRTLPTTSTPTKAPLINTPVPPTNIPTQSNNNKNNDNNLNDNSSNQKPTVTPTIIKKEAPNIFERIGLFLSDFFKRLFIKKKTINKTVKSLTPTQIPKLAPTVNISQSMIDSKQILVDLQKTLNVSAEITDTNIFNWLTQNKEIIPLMGQGFILGISASSHVGKYGDYSLSTKIQDLTEDTFKPLQNAVNDFFLSNGFQKDDLNTFRNNESYVLLFMGYTKGDLKCLFRLNPKSSLFGNFFCGIVDQVRLTWRKELTPAINTTNDSNIVVSVNKLLGNYAQGSVGSSTGQGGGAGWYAVKINGQWKEVLRGQQLTLTSCKSLQQYNFPKEIIDLEHSDVCSNSSSQSTQTPTSTPTITLNAEGKIGIKSSCTGAYMFCDTEVVPTIKPLFPCKCLPVPTPLPCSEQEGNDFEKGQCIIRKSEYRNKLNEGCLGMVYFSGLMTPTLRLVLDHCSQK